MGLRVYQQKRDFRRTPEPRGQVHAGPAAQRFVIQKHDASRLHYDFRLEYEGVLKSWALPKGPSLDPHERRLAVEVEDHPVEYGSFEGVIPEGEYGGGTVMIWDQGGWEPDGDPEEGFRQGKLKFYLKGRKLRGRWALIRMHARRGDDAGGHAAKPNWLLIKEKDEETRPADEYDVLDAKPNSAASRRTMERIARDGDRLWTDAGEVKVDSGTGKKSKTKAKSKSKSLSGAKPRAAAKGAPVAIEPAELRRLEAAGARNAPFPEKIEPQLAELVLKAPGGEHWLHEIKFDGYRILCLLRGGRAQMVTRHGVDWTPRFPTLARLAAELPAREVVLDGELVMLQADGASDFQALQNVLNEKQEGRLTYFVFDLLYLDGLDLRPLPLARRKEVLARLLGADPGRPDRPDRPSPRGAIRYSDHFTGEGEVFLNQACRHGLEGIVSKQADRPYRARRGPDWVKIKCGRRQEFVIGGYTEPAGARIELGALLVGYYNKQGRLVFAGRVGTGFTERTLKELKKRLAPLDQKTPPFVNPPVGGRGVVHWVRPELVAEVTYGSWTRDDVLRHPVFQGLREDKPAREIGREQPRPTAVPEHKEQNAEQTMTQTGEEIAGIRLTHPDRILYAEQGITKRDLAQYYMAVEQWILPWLIDRPLTLVRCPKGQGEKCFYQRHANETTPRAVESLPLRTEEGLENFMYIRSLAGLISLVQMGALEFHIWGARHEDIEHPDMMIFDMDPGPGVQWAAVVEAARAMRDLLTEAGLKSFVKTTGGKGLHVVVPLRPENEWDAVKEFARAAAERLAALDPARYTTNMLKTRRKGKVYIDYLRNARMATSVAPFSTRARPGAPVSMTLSWEELAPSPEENRFDLTSALQRLARLKRDPWAGFEKARATLMKKKMMN